MTVKTMREDVEKQEPLCPFGRKENGTVTLTDSFGSSNSEG